MLLAVDIGNTSTMFGVYEGRELKTHFRLSTNPNMSGDELGIMLINLLQISHIPCTALDGAIVCSVVPELDFAYRTMATRYLRCPITVVSRDTPTGMPNLYDHPEEVGADRIVNAVGAYEKYKAPLIIVDFGTAITFDVVSPAGEYLGGAIAPGLRIALDALFQRTSKLPRIDLVLPERALGKTTIQSMRAGVFHGYAGLVDGVVDAIRAELDFTPRVVGTGGHIALIAELSRTLEDCDDLMTLEGLRLISERLGGERARPG